MKSLSKQYCVYLMTNPLNKVIYVGVTSNLIRGCLINRPIVIPAKAGIQAVNLFQRKVGNLDPRFRGGDDALGIYETTSKRIYEHKQKSADGFTKQYNVSKPVYFETTENVDSAIAREKQLKAGFRKKKIDLITLTNPEWKDLYETLL